MPTYRSISLSLISQYDILTIPEFPPPAVSADPFSSSPQLLDTARSMVSTYVPTYPSSHFWLSYTIAPPHPPGARYYFKLMINGAEIVSWGCGQEEEYKGKTMFALCPAGQHMGKTVWERRSLAFGTEHSNENKDPMGDVMEVKVFRSRGRRRIVPTPQTVLEPPYNTSVHRYVKSAKNKQAPPKGIELANAGVLARKHPQRYYQYSLLDALDKPFTIFRYYYRSVAELYTLGVIQPTPSVSMRTSRSSLADTAEKNFEDASSDSDVPATTSDSHDAVTLNSPKSSPLCSTSSDSPASPRVLRTHHARSDLRIRKSEELVSDRSNSHQSSNPIDTKIRHVRSHSSPRRVPRLKHQASTEFESESDLAESAARPPTPPLKSPLRERPTTPAFNSSSDAACAESSHHAGLSSKDSFTNLIRETISSPEVSTMQLGTRSGWAIGKEKSSSNTNLSRSNTSRSVGVDALRRVFESRQHRERKERG